MKISLKNAVTATTFVAVATLSLLLCRCEPGAGDDQKLDSDNNHQTSGPESSPDTGWYANHHTTRKYAIRTAGELAGLALLVNREISPVDFAGDTITLMGDNISLSDYGDGYNGGTGWVPIGKDDSPFKGTFDGQGKTIHGLYIKAAGSSCKGLFGYITDGATIKKLGLDGVNVNGGSSIGGITGSANDGSKIIDCRVKGKIGGSGDYIGGIVGEMIGGEVSGCRFTGTVSGNVSASEGVGGIVGSIDGVTTVSKCYSLGDTVKGRTEVGGIAGNVVSSGVTTVDSCYSTVNVIGESYSVGGIVGIIYNNSRVIHCAALNKSVKNPGEDAGRVAGKLYNTGNTTLSGNIAFGDMEGNAAWDNKGADKQDGADIFKEALNTDGTLGGLFNAANGWTTQNGKLPGLGGAAVEMPEHLKQ
jgi:hypothetical protein